MTAILFADVSGPVETALSDLVASQGGRLLRQNGAGYLAVFETVGRALGCALAFQNDLAVRNRERRGGRPLSARLAVDRAELKKDGECAPPALDRLRAIGAVASVGRVVISRAAYLHARAGHLFAFIAIGTARTASANESVEVFEAISLSDKTWTVSTEKPALTTAVSVREPEAPNGRLAPDSVVAWLLVAIVGLIAFALHRAMFTLLLPFEIFHFVFHQAGVALFGIHDSLLARSIGALLVPVVMPALAFVHYARAQRAASARVALLWLGQSVISLGEPVLNGVAPESFAAMTRTAVLEVLYSAGAIASASVVASVLIGLGSLIVAIAVVPLVMALLGRREQKAAKEVRLKPDATA